MKYFLKKLTIFSIIPILYFGFNSIINTYLYSHQSIPLKRTRILIVGDSHPQKSVNPYLFNSARNISQPAEPYILTYWKLKKLFASNKIPDTLILGFAPHNISEFNDLKFSQKNFASEMFGRSYTIENFEEVDNLIDIDYSIYYKTLWKKIGFYPRTDHIEYIGKYSNNESSNLENWRSTIQRHYFTGTKELGVSSASKQYLDSIIDLTKKFKVKLVLISNPVHEKYYENIPSEIIAEFENLKHKYKADLTVIDKTARYYPDSLFKDTDHLNQWGAMRFTKEIKGYLQEKRNIKM